MPATSRLRSVSAGPRSKTDAPTCALIEATMHAVLLELDGVSWVGHTHPSAINAITCSLRFGELLAGRVFPEEVVVLGPASLLIEYADPGVPLGIAVRDAPAST